MKIAFPKHKRTLDFKEEVVLLLIPEVEDCWRITNLEI